MCVTGGESSSSVCRVRIPPFFSSFRTSKKSCSIFHEYTVSIRALLQRIAFGVDVYRTMQRIAGLCCSDMRNGRGIEARLMTGKRVLISTGSDSRRDPLPSNSNSQHQRPGRRKAITKENGMTILVMLSALLTKAAAVTGTMAAGTAGADSAPVVSSAVSTASAPVDPCVAVSPGTGTAPSNVMADAEPLSTVSARTAAANDISRPTPTLCCSSRQRRRHGIGFVAPPSATRLRHKHTAARSPIGALGPPTSIGGFYSRSISCGCSSLVTPPLGRRWWQHPASVITSMIVDNPAYTIVISWVAAAATVAAAVISARAGRGSLSTVAATPGGAARVVEDAGGNADDTGRRTIVSFVKWVLTEAWRGGGTGKRGKIRLSSSPRRSANGHG
ncbi:unnamed protein product, partial [Sphacelaria rigidula]